MSKLYFFGAGIRGRKCLLLAREVGLTVDGFIDNNEKLWGTQVAGLTVYPPETVFSDDSCQVSLTCVHDEQIYEQLCRGGVSRERIFRHDEQFYNVLQSALTSGKFKRENYKLKDLPDKQRLILNLEGGTILGGIESWVLQEAAYWKSLGYDGYYFTRDNSASTAKRVEVKDTTYPIVTYRYGDDGVMNELIQLIVDKLPCTAILNTCMHFMVAAAVVKQMYPDKLKIIAVQHCEAAWDGYYLCYPYLKDYLDKILVISSRIGDNLIKLGVPKDKLVPLSWEIECDKNLRREWTREGRLKLAYAGRVTYVQKRLHLLVELACELRSRGVEFEIDIAGDGVDLENLKALAEERGVSDCFRFLGYIERAWMPRFWQTHDIGVTTSEWEGRSITMSETLANGAVVVTTDVSGASDDIIDGENGYIVPIGDLPTLASRIETLYHDRAKLAQMGQRAIQIFAERQEKIQRNKDAYWKELLG